MRVQNNLKFLVIFLINMGALFARTPALLYSKEDLNILFQNQQYLEFLAHAKDLRPTERDSVWEKQVLEMAQIFIEEINSQKAYTQRNKNEISRLMELAKINQNEVFLLARKDFMIGYLEECFRSNMKNCIEQAQQILKETPQKESLTDIPASFGLVLLANNVNSIEIIHPFLKDAFISERSQFLCKKEAVRNYILSWFKNFNATLRSKKEIKLFSADNFHPNCLSSVLNFYVTNFSLLQSPIDREQIISWLYQSEYLSMEEIRTLLTVYLLKGPVNGDMFNFAWNSIRDMGENYLLRTPVLNKLKTLDPLPDEIFGLSDPLREKTLFELVSKNLPEYIDYYSKNCIDYYTGSKTFPNGNPTMNCKDFARLFEIKYGEGHPKTKLLKQALQI